jgi:hypothetical protein
MQLRNGDVLEKLKKYSCPVTEEQSIGHFFEVQMAKP